MRGPNTLLRTLATLATLLALAGCDEQSEAKSAKTNEDCTRAEELAAAGDCLMAGVHLSRCSDDAFEDVRRDVREQCPVGTPKAAAAATEATAVPAEASVPASPTEPAVIEVPPPAAAARDDDSIIDPWGGPPPATGGGETKCNEAIAAALSRDCARARSAFASCSGPKRATAQANVAKHCGAAPKPTNKVKPGDSLFH